MRSTILMSPILGPLGLGEAESWGTILTGRTQYDVFVWAHEPGVDFDLYVYDENGILIELDEEIDSSAYCSILPEWTGPFEIVIRCSRGYSTYQIGIG